jgi:hypothetical protein
VAVDAMSVSVRILRWLKAFIAFIAAAESIDYDGL